MTQHDGELDIDVALVTRLLVDQFPDLSGLPEVVLAKLAARGVPVPPGRVGLDTYGDSPGLSRELVALIREGRKRAGTSLLWAHEHEDEPLPEVGDVDVVVDHEGEPVAVTRVVRVRVVPFGDVDAAYAAVEGEGDGSLAHWRVAHWEVFGRACARIGRVPTEDMPVVCCVFEVISVVPDACEVGDHDGWSG